MKQWMLVGQFGTLSRVVVQLEGEKGGVYDMVPDREVEEDVREGEKW